MHVNQIQPYIIIITLFLKALSNKKEVEIKGETFEVTYKMGHVNGEIISSRIEFEDAKKIANKTGIPLKNIINQIGELND